MARSARPDAIGEGGRRSCADPRSRGAEPAWQVPARLVAVDWRQLANNGSEDAAFSQYNVRSVIGTDNPHADESFISLEELIAGEGTAIMTAPSHACSTPTACAFHQNLVKNMTLKAVVESSQSLTPTSSSAKSSAAERLNAHRRRDWRSCEHGALRAPVLSRGAPRDQPHRELRRRQRFANEHSDFVEAFRTSFSDISAHYHVEVPVTEIAYAYDYINSRHTPRRRATLNDGPAARQARCDAPRKQGRKPTSHEHRRHMYRQPPATA
ncbi:MAG: hypothetical protein ACLU0O_08685 [Collinsella sp.]